MTVLEGYDPLALPNLRDTGGLPVDGGRTTTRPGVLYRSALPKEGDHTPGSVPAWPARTVVDLRADVERVEGEHPLAALGARVHPIPLMADEDVAGAGQTASYDGGLPGLYRSMVTGAAPRFVEVLRAATDGEGPVLVHCAAGKDRTGVSVAMLLTLAGVDRQAVVADYTRTEAHMRAIVERLRDRGPAFAVSEGLDHLMGSPAQAVEAVLDLWEAHPGGVRGWIEAQGAEPALVDRWIVRIRSL